MRGDRHLICVDAFLDLCTACKKSLTDWGNVFDLSINGSKITLGLEKKEAYNPFRVIWKLVIVTQGRGVKKLGQI